MVLFQWSFTAHHFSTVLNNRCIQQYWHQCSLLLCSSYPLSSQTCSMDSYCPRSFWNTPVVSLSHITSFQVLSIPQTIWTADRSGHMHLFVYVDNDKLVFLGFGVFLHFASFSAQLFLLNCIFSGNKSLYFYRYLVSTDVGVSWDFFFFLEGSRHLRAIAKDTGMGRSRILQRRV